MDHSLGFKFDIFFLVIKGNLQNNRCHSLDDLDRQQIDEFDSDIKSFANMKSFILPVHIFSTNIYNKVIFHSTELSPLELSLILNALFM